MQRLTAGETVFLFGFLQLEADGVREGGGGGGFSPGPSSPSPHPKNQTISGVSAAALGLFFFPSCLAAQSHPGPSCCPARSASFGR